MKLSFNRLVNRPEQTQFALGLVALVALVFGLWQLKAAIRLPVGLGGNSTEISTEATPTPTLGDDVAALQRRDTDSDGFTDYDELYLYQTSPYLADTDSDGYGDKVEVESGNDPTCPPEGACTPAIVQPEGGESTTLGAAPTADQIRALLRQAGASEEQIAAYDDAALLQLYGEVATEAPSGSGTETTTGGSTGLSLTPEQKELVKQMTAAELRQFLMNGGVDAEVLQGVDDATLRTIVYEQLGIE